MGETRRGVGRSHSRNSLPHRSHRHLDTLPPTDIGVPVPSLTAAKPGIFSRKPSFLPSLHSSPNLSVSNHLILPDSQLCNPVLFPICEFPAAQLINYNHSFFPKLFSPEYSVFIIFYFSGRFNVLQKTYFFITF